MIDPSTFTGPSCDGPQSWRQHSRWDVPRVEQWGKIPSLAQLATLLFMHSRMQFGSWAVSAFCLLMSTSHAPQVLLSRAALGLFIPSLCLYRGLVALTQLQHLALGLVKTHDIPTSPLLELVQVPLNVISFFR